MKMIEKFRKERGMNRAEFAEKLGVATHTVFRWEQGSRTPNLVMLAKIAEVLGVTEAELLNGPQKNEWEIRVIWEIQVIIKAGECKLNVETAVSVARILGAKVEELFATQTTKAASMDGQVHKVK